MLAMFGVLLPLLAACQPPGGGGGGGAAGSSDSSGMLMSILPLVLIFVVFYFLLIRPQQRKQKAQKEMLSQVKRGDHVVTSGGMIGTVVKIDRDNNLLIEIAPNVRVKMLRSAIAEVVRRPEPARADDGEGDEEQDKQETSGGSDPKSAS
jgi:preprotein translocase subunit YajC